MKVNGYEVGPNADLREAILVAADLTGEDLTFSDLTGARLNHSNLIGANLGGADLTNATLRGAHLEGVNFSGACLAGVELDGGAIRKARFFGADLRGAKLLRDAKSLPYSESSEWHFGARVVFAGVDFTEANLERFDFADCILSGLKLRRANLRGASFERAKITGCYHVAEADFREANFCGTKWGGYVNEGSHYYPVEINEAYLAGAVADAATSWPGGFDPEAAGVVFK